jgi:predicted lipoprotein with Yx(FWY)xxD motif
MVGRGRTLATAGAVILAVAASGCATAINSLHPGRETIKATQVGTLGRVLVDKNGKTLYMFVKDPPRKSTCFGACLSIWPAVLTDAAPHAGSGVDEGKLSTITRADGSTQVVYDGHALYYYQGDPTPGDTHGQGVNQFGAPWFAVAPTGAIVTRGGVS